MDESQGIDLRLGYVTDLYYSILNTKAPKQLDLLDEWFPGFIVAEREEQGKVDAEYVDTEFTIYASRYNGSLYSSGSSSRVSQILGRLIGTAKSNQEKERKTAELIQKDVANIIITNEDATDILGSTVHEHLTELSEEQLKQFHNKLIGVIWDSTVDRYEKDVYDRLNEPFPMDDEVWDGLMYNIGYQLHLFSYDGLVNAYMWLLLGCLLRNEVGRVVRMYHSGFSAVNKQQSETGMILDKLNYLFFPEEYHSTYSGDDMEKRFPGVSWQCDKCGDILDSQPGFDDHMPVWQCRKCGYLNKIDFSTINSNTEDYINGISYTEEDIDDFNRAIEVRKKELEDNE